MLNNDDLDGFRRGYAEGMLFANTFTCDVGDEYTSEDVRYLFEGPGRWWEGIGIDFTDADDFLRSNLDTLMATGEGDMYRHGTDFAFTRNGHGAGFWDRGYPRHIGGALTNAAKAYGEASLMLDGFDLIPV